MWWLYFALSGMAWAQDLTTWFPATPLPATSAEDALAASVLGPPATTYDATATPADDDRDRRITARGEDRSAALHRYAQIALQLALEGQAEDSVHRFAAEHAGLAMAPRTVATFVTANEEDAASVVRDATRRFASDVPVVVATSDVDVGLAGIVVALDVSATLEPLPRVVSPGAPIRVAGTLNTRTPSALYVQGPRATVAVHPLTAGPFELTVAAPTAPGAYRLAIAPADPKRLPTQPYSFTVYVDRSPPERFEAPGQRSQIGKPTSKFERRLLDAIDQERKRFGLPPMDQQPPKPALRTLVEGIEVGDRSLAPKLARALQADPLPDDPHGGWAACLDQGSHGADGTMRRWAADPACRKALLHAHAEHLVLITRQDAAGRFEVLGIAVQRAPEGSLRERAWAQLAERWPAGAAPLLAPKLEAELTALATLRAADQISREDFDGRLQAVLLSTKLVPGRAWVFTGDVPPGDPLDLSAMQLEDEAMHLAVGSGTGAAGLGRGNHGCVIAVAATKAY